eukprot:COSAG05_NODE_479_length_9424_cov_38.098552_6_plen_263_part_00
MTLTADAGIETDLMIRPGQDVHITGNGGSSTVNWGSGGFAVQQGGSLFLVSVVPGQITVAGGGSASMSGGSLANLIHLVTVNSTVRLNNVMYHGQPLTVTTNQNLQCSLPYITLRDSWRSISTADQVPPGGPHHGDRTTCSSRYTLATTVGGERWYRFAGPGGDALPLVSPGVNHCGTTYTGWLSGWNRPGDPPASYNEAGRYPTEGEGLTVEMTACFDHGGSCANHVEVGVVRCRDFLLWRLSDAPSCIDAYCTVPSGLWQ